MQEFAKYDVDDISAGLQDFLICVEMFIAALAHAYSFPPRDYLDPTHPKIGFIKSIKVMFDVRDVVDDVQYAVDDTVLSSPETFPHLFFWTISLFIQATVRQSADKQRILSVCKQRILEISIS